MRVVWARGTLAGVVIAVSIATITLSSGSTANPVLPVPEAAIAPQMTDATAAGLRVAAIGDSIMSGHGLDPNQAWPTLLAQQFGWRLTNLASDGSGFVQVGDNGDTFADQARIAIGLSPDLIIFAGSSNDLGNSDAEISERTSDTIRAIRTALPTVGILAVSPIWSDTDEPSQLLTIDADTAEAAQLSDSQVLRIGEPLHSRPDLIQPDGVHPNADGDVLIARAVTEALARQHPGCVRVPHSRKLTSAGGAVGPICSLYEQAYRYLARNSGSSTPSVAGGISAG